jgi:hypothetical protein
MPEAAATGRPFVGYGGQIYVVKPEWRAKMPGVYLGDTLQDGFAALTRILRAAAGLRPERWRTSPQ